MVRKSLNIALLAGSLAGLLVAGGITLMEWWQNPGGIFQTQVGTDWHIVWQTWSSWFFPVALTVLALAWVTAFFVFWLRSRRRRKPLEGIEESGQ